MKLFKQKVKTSGKLVTMTLESVSEVTLENYIEQLSFEASQAGWDVSRQKFSQSILTDETARLPEPQRKIDLAKQIGLINSWLRSSQWQLTARAAHLESGNQLFLRSCTWLHTAAWVGCLVDDTVEKINLYRWLYDLEHNVLATKKPDLSIILDILPGHLTSQDIATVPIGWRATLPIPETRLLTERYTEIAKLFPKTKIVRCHTRGLERQDSDISNEIWNLTRRIALR